MLIQWDYNSTKRTWTAKAYPGVKIYRFHSPAGNHYEAKAPGHKMKKFDNLDDAKNHIRGILS